MRLDRVLTGSVVNQRSSRLTRVQRCQNCAVSSGTQDAASFGYLTSPPEGCGKGPIATRPQLLLLSSLAPKDFERLCFRLTRLDATVEQCRFYGVHCQAQKGIDLYARQRDGSYKVVQCKRSSDGFAPGEVTEAVDAFLADDWADKASAFILAVTANLEGTQAADRIEEERSKLTERGITFLVWDETEISAVLKDHPRLVDDFFGREAVRTFHGDDAANALGDRLDAAAVIEYRNSLGPLSRGLLTPRARRPWRRPQRSPWRSLRPPRRASHGQRQFRDTGTTA